MNQHMNGAPAKPGVHVHDPIAEAAVLSALLMDPASFERLKHRPKPSDFYAAPNRLIASALRWLHAQGTQIDLVTVVATLRAREQLEQAGGAAYVAQIADATPSTFHVDTHARIVCDLAQQRRTVACMKKHIAEGEGDVGDPKAWAAAIKADLDAIAGDAEARPYAVLSTADIFADIPATDWIVEALQLTRGRPNLLLAPGGVGKSIIAQSIALTIASEHLRLWDQFTVRHGRVLHIDHDQGGGATRKRYHRLAAGMGIHPAELAGRLEAIIRPPFYLNVAASEQAYLRECEGVDYCIVDAFRGANPGTDENDSRVRDGLDMLARVSEKVGTAFQVLHHSGKPQTGEPSNRSASRGSSAIDDGSGAQMVVSGERGAPKLVRIARDSQDYDGGQVTEPFYLDFEDVPTEGAPWPGLRVVYKTREQVDGPAKPATAAKFDKLKADILAVVQERGDQLTSSNAICARVTGGGKDVKLQAIKELRDGGLLVQPAGEGTPFRRST